jgi:hypothetical protein
MNKVIVKKKDNKTTFHFGGKPISLNKAYNLYKNGTNFGIPFLTGKDALQVLSSNSPSPIDLNDDVWGVIKSYLIAPPEDWIEAVVNHDTHSIKKMLKTYPPNILHMEIPIERFTNIIDERKEDRDGMLSHIPEKNTLTALEYAQIVKFDLGEWYISEDFWQMVQDMNLDGYNNKYKRRLLGKLKKWENIEYDLLQSSKQPYEHGERNRMIRVRIIRSLPNRFSPTIKTFTDLGYSNKMN